MVVVNPDYQLQLPEMNIMIGIDSWRRGLRSYYRIFDQPNSQWSEYPGNNGLRPNLFEEHWIGGVAFDDVPAAVRLYSALYGDLQYMVMRLIRENEGFFDLLKSNPIVAGLIAEAIDFEGMTYELVGQLSQMPLAKILDTCSIPDPAHTMMWLEEHQVTAEQYLQYPEHFEKMMNEFISLHRQGHNIKTTGIWGNPPYNPHRRLMVSSCRKRSTVFAVPETRVNTKTLFYVSLSIRENFTSVFNCNTQ